jgi:hypothetical protein
MITLEYNVSWLYALFTPSYKFDIIGNVSIKNYKKHFGHYWLTKLPTSGYVYSTTCIKNIYDDWDIIQPPYNVSFDYSFSTFLRCKGSWANGAGWRPDYRISAFSYYIQNRILLEHL